MSWAETMIYAVWEEKSNVNMRVGACEGTVTLEIETRNQKLRVWFNWEILLLRGGIKAFVFL